MDNENMDYGVRNNMGNTEYAVAGVVVGALLFLILIRRGFRGVSAGGVGISIK